jgi:malate synthase
MTVSVVYIVRPKMHRPEEVAVACALLAAVDSLPGLDLLRLPELVSTHAGKP